MKRRPPASSTKRGKPCYAFRALIAAAPGTKKSLRLGGRLNESARKTRNSLTTLSGPITFSRERMRAVHRWNVGVIPSAAVNGLVSSGIPSATRFCAFSNLAPLGAQTRAVDLPWETSMKPLDRVAVYGARSNDTCKKIEFEFDGKSYQGLEGDSLAAALIANGVDIVGRSFKLHRPRGIMGAGVEETNGLVQLESGEFDEPNVRATLMPLYPGLRAASQNAWPNAEHDVFGVLDAFQRLLPASFYYKSMMWPNWHFYERFVRPIAGLGKAPKLPDGQKYQKRNVHCDLLIVGGGPAGLAAALVAGHAGLRVIVEDDREDFGCALLAERFEVDGAPAKRWVENTVAHLRQLPNVQLLPRTNVSGYYENNFLVAAERVSNHLGPKAQKRQLRERLWRIRSNSVILATGAIERPLVFANNDRPGVML